jgi:uncharacterized protein (DUF2252 family)
VARGKAAREKVPRRSQEHIEFAADRDPIALLEEQASSRVPALVPIRYGRMLSSPFAFFRGGALIMAADLARTPSSGIRVQACGDAHLSNFGGFGSPERQFLFDINDFDETAPGPWEWDVKRLAASQAIAGREWGFSSKERRTVVLESVRSYQEAMAGFAAMRNLDVWYASLPLDRALIEYAGDLGRARLKRTKANLDKARTRDSLQAFAKLTEVTDQGPRIVGDPPLIVPIDQLSDVMDPEAIRTEIHETIRAYRRTLPPDRRHLLEQFRFVDAAHKVVGVGSVGTRAWIALFLGVDDRDPLFLQIKEAQASVLERFVGKSAYAQAGHRVVAGQRLMQAASDIFLGWHRRVSAVDGKERDFYVRQLRDWKWSISVVDPALEPAVAYAKACGWTLARAHARSGDRVAIAAYLGSSHAFAEALAGFAETYADQNERDFAALQAAVAEGRVTAAMGV